GGGGGGGGGGEPVHLLGHSRGGNLALRLALAAPDALRSLSLADPGGDYAAEVYAHAGLPAPEEPLERNQFRRQALELIRGGEAERGLELFVDTVSGAGVWKRSSATFRRMTLDNAMTLVGQVADQPPALALTELRSIDLPSLILNGERSPLPFPATAEALAAALPRAELQRIQGASHGLNATRPAAFNRSVLEFLARVDGVAPDVETS
ncbi:alpha/beta fold hydrolase, partial [Pseudomonas aeruginosa]